MDKDYENPFIQYKEFKLHKGDWELCQQEHGDECTDSFEGTVFVKSKAGSYW